MLPMNQSKKKYKLADREKWFLEKKIMLVSIMIWNFTRELRKIIQKIDVNDIVYPNIYILRRPKETPLLEFPNLIIEN